MDNPVYAFILTMGNGSAAHVPLALFLIFGAAKVLSEVFERLGQPGIVGEILAGVILGPSLLNWVRPDHVIETLAEMGAMFLLFRVGLEVKASDLFRLGKTALSVALLGVAFPFVLGWFIADRLGHSSAEAIFVGTAMVATSVGITAQVLASKGWLSQRASKVILAAAVIDDILGLIILAFVSSLSKGRIDVASLVSTAVLASGFTFVIAWFGARTFQRIVPAIEQKLSAKDAQFNLALVVLFGLSFVAIYIGVAAIVGAFLAGLAFSETVNGRVQDMAHGVTELLVPFFLANIGLQLNILDFMNGDTLLFSTLLFTAAVITKLLGCGLGAIHLGRTDALRVGIGMTPRGEVGMVVAQIGLGLGIITQAVYAAVVFMAIGTTLIAPPLLKRAFRDSARQTPPEDFGQGSSAGPL